MRAFIDAYNRGDGERLDSLFADEPDFEWFSTDGPGPRLGPDSRKRDTLLGYFRSRHARHDRLALISFG